MNSIGSPTYTFAPLCRALLNRLVIALAILLGAALPLNAQTKKLPSVDKIIDNYVKALGGKKAVASFVDATYEWDVQVEDQTAGTAKLYRRAPASERWELTLNTGQIISATNSRSAWEIDLNKKMRTFTGAEAAAAKLRGVLDASHLVNFKKSNVLARVVSLGDLGSEPAYIVEFSTRAGARLHYYFSVKTGLITKVTGDVIKTKDLYAEYRPEKNLTAAHQLKRSVEGVGDVTLKLRSVQYNSGLAENIFDPPGSTENLDVVALLRDVGKNQDDTEKRVAEYAFKETETDRQIDGKGVLKKETVKVYEVYPIAHREAVRKLISENGVPLSAEKAAKEEKRVLEEFEKAERNREKDERESEKRKAEREKKNREAGQDADEDPEISQFLRVCEFVSPRREVFGDRDTIVFDFRPRAGFKPKSREESLIAKLVGVVWIDPIDKQVIRLEARLAEGFKMAGGLLVSLKPGAAMVMEQKRMAEGVWLPRFAQVNLSVKVLLFAGGDFNKTVEWSDYRHFSGDVKDYKLEGPKP
jgi:hypothetical protein